MFPQNRSPQSTQPPSPPQNHTPPPPPLITTHPTTTSPSHLQQSSTTVPYYHHNPHYTATTPTKPLHCPTPQNQSSYKPVLHIVDLPNSPPPLNQPRSTSTTSHRNESSRLFTSLPDRFSRRARDLHRPHLHIATRLDWSIAGVCSRQNR